MLDPSGNLVEKTIGPIRSYLRNREDAVRCILNSLLDETNEELYEELQKGSLIDIESGDVEEAQQTEGEWEPCDSESSESLSAACTKMLTNSCSCFWQKQKPGYCHYACQHL